MDNYYLMKNFYMLLVRLIKTFCLLFVSTVTILATSLPVQSSSGHWKYITEGQIVSGNMPANYNYPAEGVKEVQFYIDNKLINTDTTSGYWLSGGTSGYDTRQLSDDPHVLKAVVVFTDISKPDHVGLLNFVVNNSGSTTCISKATGDADCNGKIDLMDFEVFRQEYNSYRNGQTVAYSADFNGDKKIDLLDFEIFRQGYLARTATPTPTTSTATPTPTTITASPTPAPTGTTVQGSGIWISKEEILKLPMSGTTWNSMKSIADGTVGTANMSDQNSTHPVRTMAVALVAVRTGDSTYLNKAVTELVEAIGTENNLDPDCASHEFGARGLAVARNLIGYAVAADVIDLRKGGYDPGGNGTKFQEWIVHMLNRRNCDNNGERAFTETLAEIHDQTTSNGNALAGGARIAAAAYLKNKTEVDKAWITYRRYVGDASVGPNWKPNSYSGNWKSSDYPSYVGINKKGAMCSNTSSSYPADGVIPNDQGRGGNCPTSSGTAPGYTAYPWEGLQGIYAQAVILHRLGYKDPYGNDPWRTQDSALLRAVQYQWYLQSKFGGSWYDSSRAAWVKHLAYKYYNYKPLNYSHSGGGRNIDWTQWTHQ
jgi:hypothetical protein